MIVFQEMSKRLKTQELENIRQVTIISQQGEVINRLEAVLMTSDQKCKPEVQETGEINCYQNFLCNITDSQYTN